MYVGTDASGGFQVDTVLTRKAFLTPQPMSLFRFFLSVRENLGKNQGDLVYRNRWGNVSTAGAAVLESATIPTDRSMVLSQATATVAEYANSVSFHSKLRDLANIDINDPIMQGMRDDEKKMINSALYTNVYSACMVKYAGTATDGNAITSNGTATATATSVLNSYHLRQIRKQLRSLHVPTLASGKYGALLSLGAADNLRDDADWKNVQINDNRYDGLVTSYMGSLHGFDLFEDDSEDYTDPETNNTASGEAFFLGQGYGTEDMVQPPEIISNAAIAKMMGSAADFGRKLEMAHYQMAAFGTLWNVSGGQCHGVHWTSA